MDYQKLIKGKEVVKEFPKRGGFGFTKSAASELINDSDYNVVYRIGPIKKDHAMNSLRAWVLELAKRDKIKIDCRTHTEEKGVSLYFKKIKDGV